MHVLCICVMIVMENVTVVEKHFVRKLQITVLNVRWIIVPVVGCLKINAVMIV